MPILLQFIIAVFAKTFSKLFSLATITFLGRVPSRDDSKISFIGLLSLYWLFLFISLISPHLANIAIPFIPNNPLLVRTLSVALLVSIPLITGWTTTKMENYEKKQTAFWKQLLLGYPYTLLLGLLVTALIIMIPIVKAPIILKMYKVENLKIMIHKGEFDQALLQIQKILDRHHIKTRVHQPSKIMWGVVVVLVKVLNSLFKRDMSKNMKIIKGTDRGNDLQITLHSTDISIAAKREISVEVMAILSEELNEEHMYFSWDNQSQKIEDKIKSLREALGREEEVNETAISELSEQLHTSGLAKEEWNSVRRQIYRLECDYYKKLIVKNG